MLQKFLENSILYGDESKGIEITRDDGLYVYENVKKYPLVTSDGNPAARACGCSAEDTARGSYHLDEIEVSVCPKCGGLIVKVRKYE